uniref:Putative ovule protein n=1 Tax=Solanum chacoense TaxID=4108 RepID=A0A0V0HIN5_SOLCH
MNRRTRDYKNNAATTDKEGETDISINKVSKKNHMILLIHRRKGIQVLRIEFMHNKRCKKCGFLILLSATRKGGTEAGRRRIQST